MFATFVVNFLVFRFGSLERWLGGQEHSTVRSIRAQVQIPRTQKGPDSSCASDPSLGWWRQVDPVALWLTSLAQMASCSSGSCPVVQQMHLRVTEEDTGLTPCSTFSCVFVTPHSHACLLHSYSPEVMSDFPSIPHRVLEDHVLSQNYNKSLVLLPSSATVTQILAPGRGLSPTHSLALSPHNLLEVRLQTVAPSAFQTLPWTCPMSLSPSVEASVRTERFLKVCRTAMPVFTLEGQHLSCAQTSVQ